MASSFELDLVKLDITPELPLQDGLLLGLPLVRRWHFTEYIVQILDILLVHLLNQVVLATAGRGGIVIIVAILGVSKVSNHALTNHSTVALLEKADLLLLIL